MKWIRYQVVQDTNGEEVILLTKKIGHSEANLAIAQAEAYNGEYTIEEDSKSFDEKPLAIEFGGTGAKTAAEALTRLGAMPKSGGTFTGKVEVSGGSGNVDIFSDNEGGNIVIHSPTANGDCWQMDSYDGNLRFFHSDNSVEADHRLTFDKDGVIHPTGGYGGGTFTGTVSVNIGNHSDTSLYNMDVWKADGSTKVSTSRIKFCRK